MKKCIKMISILILLCLFTSCTNINKDKRVSCQNTIYSKSEAIQEAKDLLQITDIYFFDCDFTKMETITIADFSYNISVTGNLIFDDVANRYRIDLNNQADIKIVTNYSIETDSKCFGFSVISSLMIPRTDHYINGKIDYTNANIIYDSSTYSGISELHNNGQTTYQNNVSTREIKVPENFFPCKLMPDAVSIKSSYLKIEGNINSIEPIKVLDTPVSIVAHYKSYSDKNAESEKSTILEIIDYFNSNAKYVRY